MAGTTVNDHQGDALAGLKVLDLSWVVAGPLIGRTLADFGAQVVRVESSVRIETARLMQPFHGGVQDKEGSALFGNCNAGKLGLTLDLKSAEGQQVVRDLVAWADVVVESFSPGQLARWGLDYDTLRADKFSRALVWLASTDDVRRAFLTEAGFAPDGAHRELDLHGDGSVRVKQVRLHADLTEG